MCVIMRKLHRLLFALVRGGGIVLEFYYKAKAANGSIMRGSKAADSEPEIIAWIRDNGWTPINIQSASSLKQSTAPPGQQQA